MNDTLITKKRNKLSKQDIVKICLLTASFLAAVFMTVFFIIVCYDTAERIIKLRQEIHIMSGFIYSLAHFFSFVGYAILWTAPLILAIPTLSKTKNKSFRIIGIILCSYALFGIIACFIVCFGLHRWI